MRTNKPQQTSCPFNAIFNEQHADSTTSGFLHFSHGLFSICRMWITSSSSLSDGDDMTRFSFSHWIIDASTAWKQVSDLKVMFVLKMTRTLQVAATTAGCSAFIFSFSQIYFIYDHKWNILSFDNWYSAAVWHFIAWKMEFWWKQLLK